MVQPHRFRGFSSVGRVRPDVIVVVPPAFDHGTRLGEAAEDLLVQALVSQLAVEAFDEAVLLGLARSDVVPVHAGAVGPFEHDPAGHLGSVIADDSPGPAAARDQHVQFASQAVTPRCPVSRPKV